MEPKYIAAWGAAEVLSIPHAQFIALLRKNREMLPLALNGEAIKQKFGTTNLSDRIEILREDMEEFYSGKVASEYILSFACLAVQDVQEYKRQQRDSLKRDKARNDLSFQLAEARTRIAELEQELAACREQLEEARRDISGREGHEPAHSEDFPAEYEGHGIFTMVAKLVEERASVEDIMRLLADEKDFLSNREDGYFFHPSPEGKAASTLRNYIKNRLNKKGVNS